MKGAFWCGIVVGVLVACIVAFGCGAGGSTTSPSALASRDTVRVAVGEYGPALCLTAEEASALEQGCFAADTLDQCGPVVVLMRAAEPRR